MDAYKLKGATQVGGIFKTGVNSTPLFGVDSAPKSVLVSPMAFDAQGNLKPEIVNKNLVKPKPQNVVQPSMVKPILKRSNSVQFLNQPQTQKIDGTTRKGAIWNPAKGGIKKNPELLDPPKNPKDLPGANTTKDPAVDNLPDADPNPPSTVPKDPPKNPNANPFDNDAFTANNPNAKPTAPIEPPTEAQLTIRQSNYKKRNEESRTVYIPNKDGSVTMKNPNYPGKSFKMYKKDGAWIILDEKGVAVQSYKPPRPPALLPDGAVPLDGIVAVPAPVGPPPAGQMIPAGKPGFRPDTNTIVNALSLVVTVASVGIMVLPYVMMATEEKGDTSQSGQTNETNETNTDGKTPSSEATKTLPNGECPDGYILTTSGTSKWCEPTGSTQNGQETSGQTTNDEQTNTDGNNDEAEYACYQSCCTQYGTCNMNSKDTGSKPTYTFTDYDGNPVQSDSPDVCKVTNTIGMIYDTNGTETFTTDKDPTSVTINGQTQSYDAYAIDEFIAKGAKCPKRKKSSSGESKSSIGSKSKGSGCSCGSHTHKKKKQKTSTTSIGSVTSKKKKPAKSVTVKKPPKKRVKKDSNWYMMKANEKAMKEQRPKRGCPPCNNPDSYYEYGMTMDPYYSPEYQKTQTYY